MALLHFDQRQAARKVPPISLPTWRVSYKCPAYFHLWSIWISHGLSVVAPCHILNIIDAT